MSRVIKNVRFLSWVSLFTALVFTASALSAPGDSTPGAAPATPAVTVPVTAVPETNTSPTQPAADDPFTTASGEPLFNLFVPTQHADPHVDDKGRPDRHGVATMEFNGVTLEQGGTVLQQLQQTPGLLPQFGPHDRRPIVEVVVANGRSPEERQARLAAATAWANQVYAGKNPKVVLRTMDDMSPQVIADAIDKHIDTLQSQYPDTPEYRADFQVLRDSNKQALEDAKQAGTIKKLWLRFRGWWSQSKWNPTNLDKADPTKGGWRKYFTYLAGGKALFNGAGRAAQSLPSVLPDLLGGNWLGAAAGTVLPLTDGGAEYYLGRYEVAIGNNYMAGGNFDPEQHPFLSKVYPAARGIGKGILVNALIRPAQASVLLHLANSAAPLLGVKEYAQLSAFQLVAVGVYLKALEGIELMHQKGVLSRTWGKGLLRTTGAFWPLAGLAFISPSPAVRALKLVVPIPILTAQFSIYGAGKMFKPRNDRIVLVDSAINNRPALEDTHPFDSTLKAAGNSPEEVAAVARVAMESPGIRTAGPSLFGRLSAALSSGTCGRFFRRFKNTPPTVPPAAEPLQAAN